MIIIEGTIRVGNLEAARPHMRAVIAATRAERGCIDYAFAEDVMDPTLIRISERWESLDALKAHAVAAHFLAWRSVGAELGISERNLRMYEAEPTQL